MCKTWLLLTWFLLSCSMVRGNQETINQKYHDVCSGMYSKKDYNGKVEPFISFTLEELSLDREDEYAEGISVAVFDFQDYEHIGVRLPNGDIQYICDDYALDLGLCDISSEGQFIIQDKAIDPFTNEEHNLTSPILTFTQQKLGTHEKTYAIKKTGYYCVTTSSFISSNSKFRATVNFRNAYGQLDASEAYKLPIYAFLAIAYVLCMIVYSWLCWKHRQELLPLQKYILVFFVFLTADTIFVWMYYVIENQKGGSSVALHVYMIFISIFSAGKMTFTFLLALLISFGYGIVYPKLDRTLLRRCQIFAVFTFAICVAFLLQKYSQNSESLSNLILITAVPMVICIFAFYYLTLSSMNKTMTYLREQKQVVKLNMYKKLIILSYFSLFILFLGLLVSTFAYVGMDTIEMIEQYWKTEFLITDIWPSIVYFLIFIVFAFIWRPTGTSYLLACSHQLPTDMENVSEFDLDDINSLSDEAFSNRNPGDNYQERNHSLDIASDFEEVPSANVKTNADEDVLFDVEYGKDVKNDRPNT
ncbi:YHL017W [Saccharomyces arboricola H-6]|uniref:YHL017W n=1 Tax=Saccharomyces arboricola (strain H-6 / AS 2.3317 / CBS 10644) TaxID=1160507 RepID=J8Q4E8_SACAR|nr:YHL017W [Saccharomyces arboricola H-6]